MGVLYSAEKIRLMVHIFVTNEQLQDGKIAVSGSDFNHLRNVLRMKEGERLTVTVDETCTYDCEIAAFTADQALLDILSETAVNRELSAEIVLFQGLPKGDKLELIIQKATELGASEIVPVLMKRTIVKPDEKKAETRRKRYQAIAESAAKQSLRERVPKVSGILSMKEAVSYARGMDLVLIPYECAENMAETRRIIAEAPKHKRIGIFIGPEGGFDPGEVSMVTEAGGKTVTLGKRILRTETAGLAILAVLMMQLD